jgi:hypothetical protein
MKSFKASDDTLQLKYPEYMKFLDQEVKSDDRETYSGM